jgi:hypothetical protein
VELAGCEKLNAGVFANERTFDFHDQGFEMLAFDQEVRL